MSDAIHLQHHAVDFVRQRLALRLPFAAEGKRLIDILTQAPPGIDLEAVVTEPVRLVRADPFVADPVEHGGHLATRAA